MTSQTFTLITGGSAGIGKAFAIECARRGHNLLLVALPGPELEETADYIRSSYPVKVHSLGIDLTHSQSPLNTYNWCIENGYKVNILINNAGVGGTSEFESSNEEYIDQTIQLNIRALVLLSRYFIPLLKENEESFILNVSSLSAFFTIPYKSVYAASKSFVLAFSDALQIELDNTTVKVCVVCPAGVDTTPETNERIKAHGFFGKITQINSERLAWFTLNKMFKGKTVIIPNRFNMFIWFLSKIVPERIKRLIVHREFRKEFCF